MLPPDSVTPAAMPAPPGGVAVIIPAKDEADRVAATVASARLIPGADVVIVVDDGSSDATAHVAHAAGAIVMRHDRNRGKAAAMLTGAQRAARYDLEHPLATGEDAAVPAPAVPAGVAPAGVAPAPAGGPGGTTSGLQQSARALLFVDADLEGTAINTAPLAAPILAGDADMTIAVLPKQRTAGGGRGFVVGLSRWGIRQATGWTATQPLSGMRCLTREAFEAAQPLAPGWGVETGLTVDLLQAGQRVLEVPCELHHRVTGGDWHGQVHRLRQFRDVGRALASRWLRRAVPLSWLDARRRLARP